MNETVLELQKMQQKVIVTEVWGVLLLEIVYITKIKDKKKDSKK